MGTIVIGKVRSEHDVEWRTSLLTDRFLRAIGLSGMADRLAASDGRPFLSQLTLPYLAALGEAYRKTSGAGFGFRIVDEPEERFEAALPPDTEVVLLTTNTPGAPATYRVADRLRRRGIVTVLGGIHPSACPDEAVAHADSVVVGEAEGVLGEVLGDIATWGRPRSPLYRGGRIPSLEGLPVPRWRDAAPGVDLCPWVVPVQTSRGCRNACAFCSTTGFQGARRRHRPVEEVVAEIRTLKEEGILTPEKTVFFTDNNIVSDTDHRRGIQDTSYARSLFRALIPLGIDWVGQGEVGVADDPELLALAVESGCHMLLVGFESLEPSNLEAVGKPCNRVEDYARQVEVLHRHGVALIGCFIFGMDHDTPETFARSLPFISRYIDVPQVSLMTPFPGTALFRRLEREGRIMDRDWSHYDVTHVVFRPARMSPEELEAGYQWLTDRLFRPEAIVHRALRYTLQRTIPGLNPLPARSRFSSVLSTNLVYRKLARIGREPSERRVTSSRSPRPAWLPSLPSPGIR